MKTISLCMIVRNEQDDIGRCLESAAPLADEIILVDTGCEDETLARAAPFHPKVYRYEWDNDFGAARTFSLSKASCDWILVLDADESLYEEDLPLIRDTVERTKADGVHLLFHNLTVSGSENEYTTHLGLRLFKNHRFRFTGTVHEQIEPIPGAPPCTYDVSAIRIRHTGYLKEKMRRKHGRNLPLIEQALEKNPDDAFMLFNLGNEYMSSQDYEAAAAAFEKANAHRNLTLAYCPHLLFRWSLCLHNLGRQEQGLAVLGDALAHYPACTDMEFMRGLFHKQLRHYSLAADSFQKCAKMGDAPLALRFLGESAVLRALSELGSLYLQQQDPPRALRCFLDALERDANHTELVYKVGETLNCGLADKGQVLAQLDNLFDDPHYSPNVLLMTDVLLNEGLYGQAEQCYDRIRLKFGNWYDKSFLLGRMAFYRKAYGEALDSFLKLGAHGGAAFLPQIRQRTLGYAAAAAAILSPPDESLSPLYEDLPDSSAIKAVFSGLSTGEFTPVEGKMRPLVFSILSCLLKVQEFDVFEKSLEILNYIDSPSLLVDLALVYEHNGHRQMAVDAILRSIRETGYLNAQAVELLGKAYPSA